MKTICAAKTVAAIAITACSWGHALAQTPEFHVTGALESAQGAKLLLTDKRPPPQQRNPKVPTAQGELARFDEKNFDQPPIEALKHALAEQLNESTLVTLGSGLELTALDIAIGEKRGRRINLDNSNQINGRLPSSMQDVVGLSIGNAIAGALLQSAADRGGSRLVFVNLLLDNQGSPVSCQGAGSFSADGVVMGWHAAIREAAARCAKLMGPSEPLNDPLPNRVR